MPAALLASLLTAAFAGERLAVKTMQNQTIAQLASGKDVAVGRDGAGRGSASPAPISCSRATVSTKRNRWRKRPRAPRAPRIQAALFYDMANARMRLAFSLIEAAQLDKAIPQLRLAKDDYRRALRARSRILGRALQHGRRHANGARFPRNRAPWRRRHSRVD